MRSIAATLAIFLSSEAKGWIIMKKRDDNTNIPSLTNTFQLNI
jgi:hypothetical protein